MYVDITYRRCANGCCIGGGKNITEFIFVLRVNNYDMPSISYFFIFTMQIFAAGFMIHGGYLCSQAHAEGKK